MYRNPKRESHEINPSTIAHSPTPFDNLSSSEILGLLLRHLEEDHNLSEQQIYSMLSGKEQEPLIPLSIFSGRLSSLETICKYLIENLGMKTSEVAKLLNRNVRTVWATHKKAAAKFPEKFALSEKDRFFIPASKFGSRRLSVLETIVSYLKESYKLSLHQIAQLLGRDDSTIWTVYHRAGIKRQPK